jgi:cytidylate kinase
MRSPRSVSALVDEQVERWQAPRRKEPPRHDIAPLITVSRQYGAHGGALARLVAERLGFSYWNHELIGAMARHGHIDEQALQAFDEHHRAPLADAISGMGPSDYFRELTHVVHQIARGGRAVIVGRGVQFLLDPEHVLRVRIVAPADLRAQLLVGRRGLDLRAARLEVEERDRDRRDFIRDHYGKDIDDPTGYDLWINAERISPNAASDAIIAAFQGRFATARATRAM